MVHHSMTDFIIEFDQITVDEKETEDNDSDTIYRSSRFFIRYDKKYQECNDTSDEDVSNRFYNPEYMKDFLKKHIAYLPLLSKLFTSYKCSDNFERPNQGSIEGNFGGVKNWIRKDLKVELGHLKCGRYIDALQKKIEIDQKEIDFNIPDRHLSRKVKSQDQQLQSTIQASQEGWKAKSKLSSTLFFNPENVLHKTSKSIEIIS